MSGVASPSLSNVQADAVLNLVKPLFRIVLTSASRLQPGQPVTASLIPSEPSLDVSDLANGVLNLAWTAKDLLFDNPNPVELPTPENATTPDSLDGDEVLQSSALGTIIKKPFPVPVGGPTVTQTAGVLAQLFGTLALPRLKVEVSVRWRVADANGVPITEDEHFLVPQGLTSPNLSLLLRPVFREMRVDSLLNPAQGSWVACLSAEVTLRLGARTLTFPVGPLPVIQLPLLIPTVLVFFHEFDFGLTNDGMAVIVVPDHSPFSSAETLFKTLQKLNGVADALRGLGGLAGFFLGLGELLGSVPEMPALRFIASSAIKEMKPYKIKPRPWYNTLGDHNFDDLPRSLIVFGMPGTKVQFFNDTNFTTGGAQGSFDIELKATPSLATSDYFVAIRTLDTDDDSAPITFPPGRVTRFEPDTNVGGDDRWFGDMSSLRFHSSWLAKVEDDIKNPPPVPELKCR
jgi:hypothetical protein